MAKSKGRRLAEFLRRLNSSGRVEDASDIFDTSASLTTSSALSSGTISSADDDDTKLATNAAVIDHVDSKLTALGLQDLSNTTFTGLTSGHVLSYNGTNWVNSNDFIGLTDLSVGTPNSASGSGAISYSNSTGEFKYTPPDLSSYLTTAFINDEGSAASLDLDNLTASSDEGYYSWGSTQPTNSPGWTYGGVLILRDQNQNHEIAFGGSGNGAQRLAIRRADSGTYNSWTEFWSTADFSSTDITNWNTAYSSIYTNSSVDSHLNQSNPTSGYVLSWNGSDYAWIAQSGGWSGGTLSANILLNKTNTATSSNDYPSYSLILRGSGWDANGSYASDVDWYIRNETTSSNYPDGDLVFYEQDPAHGHEKLRLHGRGSGASYQDANAATFQGNVHILPTTDATGGNLVVGDGTDTTSHIEIKAADDSDADDLQFYNGTTRMGEIGTQDTTWLRINQETAKNIYTPRYIRADGGFFIDGTSKGLDGSGNLIGGMSVTAGAISGTTLTLSTINEIGSDWNPVVLEDSGVIKKDSAVLVHGSGYLQAAYLNMTHGSSGSTSDTVFYSSGDNYIRKNNAAGFLGSLVAATANSNLVTADDANFRNYVYNTTGGTATRGGYGYHVYQCWSNNLSLNVTDSSWQRGDIIDFINVRGAVNITVTGSRIYMPNGSYDTVVTWNSTKGGFRLIKYSTTTGYWMVGNLL